MKTSHCWSQTDFHSLFAVKYDLTYWVGWRRGKYRWSYGMDGNQLGTNGGSFFRSYGTKIVAKKVMGPNFALRQSYGTKIATKKVMGLNWNLCQSYGTKSVLQPNIYILVCFTFSNEPTKINLNFIIIFNDYFIVFIIRLISEYFKYILIKCVFIRHNPYFCLS